MARTRNFNSRGNVRLDWPKLTPVQRAKLLAYLDNVIESATNARNELGKVLAGKPRYEIEQQRLYWKNVRSGYRWLRHIVESTK